MKNFGLLIFSIAIIIGLDQLCFLFDGHHRSHSLYCVLKECSEHPFMENKEVGFLINPEKKKYLKKLSRSKAIPPHNDYQLNDYGFRLKNDYDHKKRKNVNVYGDSFTFGLFLNEQQNFIELMNQQSESCHFRNYGVPAFDVWQMVKLRHSRNLALHAEFHLFLFISDNLMRITRPFKIHYMGRKTTTHELATFSNLKGATPPINLPLWLIKNSYFFQKLYQVLDQKWWWSIASGDVIKFFISREYDNTRFIHIPTIEDFKKGTEGLDFSPPEGLGEFSTEGFKNMQEPATYFFKGDGHPNIKGAQLIAEEVLKRLKDECP